MLRCQVGLLILTAVTLSAGCSRTFACIGFSALNLTDMHLSVLGAEAVTAVGIHATTCHSPLNLRHVRQTYQPRRGAQYKRLG